MLRMQVVKKVAARTDFCFRAPGMASGWLCGGVNLDVALWVGRHERGAGQNEFRCSAEWTLGIDP